MNSLISVIVPVYRVEKYLPKCIESILVQTYTNFELILVEDGSPDNSGQICDEYAQKDSRIKVIHKKNGGVSSARNVGIENASGEFVCFVDGDDWLNENSLEILINRYNDENAELIVGSYNIISKENKAEKKYAGIFQNSEIARNLLEIYLSSNSVWFKLFKKSIIEKYILKFNPNMPLGEDALFCMEYLLYCKKIIFVEDVVYNYNRINNESAVTRYYEDCDLYHLYIFEATKKIVESSDLQENIKKIVISTLANKFATIAMNHYLRNIINTKILENKLRMVLDKYREYLSLECFNKSYVQNISKKEFEYFVNGNVEYFLKEWRKNFWKRDKVIFCKFYIKFALKKLRTYGGTKCVHKKRGKNS